MVWGGISALHRTQLIIVDGTLTAARYRDEILTPVVLPFLEEHGENMVFQQDNARPHTARIINEFFDDHDVRVLPWPSVSPDLSPIEHVWDEMERRLRRLPQQPSTLRQLRIALLRVWQDIPQTFHARLVNSMRRRCTAVIDANGGHTRY